MTSISESIMQLVKICRDHGVEPNRVRLLPKDYQMLCREKAATYVAGGMRFDVSPVYTDSIRVDRWSRRWGASKIHASQTTWRPRNGN